MSAGPPKPTHRLAVHGLRAVAVVLVVLDHVHFAATGGYVGVDVFFVISGFLITGHIVRELDRDGRVDLVAFWGRRMRRILPAALLVALATFVGAVVLMPPLGSAGLVRMLASVAAYVPNMLLAADGTDYLGETSPSPFQHFWSLGVEEQFYLLWPLLLLAAWCIPRRRRTRAITVVVTLTVVVSFALCIVVAGIAQPWAFFSLPTRAWELALGGLVALLLRRGSVLSGRSGAVVAWLGLAAILVAGFVYDAATPYPGIATLLPVLGTVAFLVGGSSGPSHGPVALLGLRPFQFVGTVSYSLYLWHWPLIVLPQAAVGLAHPLPAWVALPEMAIAFALAVLTHRFVEEPFRRARWAWLTGRVRTVVAGAAASVAVAAVGFAALPGLEARPLSTDRPASATERVQGPPFTSFVPSNLLPSLAAASGSSSAVHRNGCHIADRDTTAIGHCVMADPEGALTVALVGDSHAAHWFGGLERWADERGGVRLLEFSKAGCPVAEVDVVSAGTPFDACTTWRADVLERLRAERPDVVLVSNSNQLPFVGNGPRIPAWTAGLERLFAALPASSRVTVLANTPQFAEPVPRCLSANLDDTAACAGVRDVVLDDDWIDEERAVTESHGHAYVDLNDWLCDADRCGVIQGDLLVYRDQSHLTEEFSRSMWRALGAAVDSAR